MQRIKKAYAENGDLKIIPETPPLDGSENWEQGRGAYYELDNDPNTGDPLALDIDREQDNYFKNIITKNIKHWQENTYPIYFNDIKYPKNATVKYTDGNVYVSLVDNNTALPTNTSNWAIYGYSSLDGQFVKLTGNETIAGVKTFSSSPIVPTPTTNFQVANKEYVDSKTLNINSLSNKLTPINTDNFVLQEVGGDLKKLTWANLKATLSSAGDGTFTQSFANNGWCKMPNGLIIQWGKTVALGEDNTGVAVTFPIAFTTACYSVTTAFTAYKRDGAGTQGVSSISTTEFTVFNGHDITGNFRWIAVGK